MVKMIEGRAAVVVIDVQYDFLPRGAIPAVDRWEIAPGINRLTNAGRQGKTGGYGEGHSQI